MMANFYTQGEICSNGTRVFVEERLHNTFMEQLVARTQRMVIGDPMDPHTHVGALISKDHAEKVLAYIAKGREEGATVAVGGGRPDDPALANGNFVQPTVFDACSDDMTIVREEIFGPVMAVLTFRDEDEAVARANATEYGLAAGVFTRDIARAHRVVARLQAGTCWINNYNITPIEMPFGGYKLSGLGRENGRAAIEHYTQIKSVYVETGDVDCPY
jgi:betaine-aldehyde dehydrogenase